MVNIEKRLNKDVESAIRDGRHFKNTESKRYILREMIDRYAKDVLPKKVM